MPPTKKGPFHDKNDKQKLTADGFESLVPTVQIVPGAAVLGAHLTVPRRLLTAASPPEDLVDRVDLGHPAAAADDAAAAAAAAGHDNGQDSLHRRTLGRRHSDGQRSPSLLLFCLRASRTSRVSPCPSPRQN